MVTVYTLTYNEKLMLPFFIEHYRSRFPDCRIVVYDNESTDNTVAIALANNCEVRYNRTGGKLDDLRYLEIKNNCWKDAKTDWVIVCDCDELIELTPAHLQDYIGFYRGVGYNMVAMSNSESLESICYGVRSGSYDKIYAFNKSKVNSLTYHAGAHAADIYPTYLHGGACKCYHYKYINPDYMVKRHKEFAERLSDVNKQRGFGAHYQYTEQQIRKEFENARKQAILVRKNQTQ